MLRRMLVWCTMKALDCSGKSLKLTVSLGSPRASSSASLACFSSFRLLQSGSVLCGALCIEVESVLHSLHRTGDSARGIDGGNFVDYCNRKRVVLLVSIGLCLKVSAILVTGILLPAALLTC